jgi:TonB family protein
MIRRVRLLVIPAMAAASLFSGQLAKAQIESAIALHQKLSSSCELIQPAVLRDEGKFASVAVPGSPEEIYSPELSDDDFLVLSPNLPEGLVKLARNSGFRVKSSSDFEDTTPRVADKNGSGQCMGVQEGMRLVAQEQDQRRRIIQSKVYSVFSDGIMSPAPILPQATDLEAATTGAALPAPGHKRAKPKVQGTVLLALVVGVDGSVLQVKILRSTTKELDKKAAETAESWKFVPARKNGMPVPVLVNIETNFKLY